MDPRILLLLPNSALVGTARRVLERMGLDFPVHEMRMREALEFANGKTAEGLRIVISRGMTAAYLRSRLSIPVFEIQYDFFHFAAALRKALRQASVVSVIGFTEPYRLAERAREYVRREGQEIHVRILPSADDAERAIREEAAAGIRVFVGGRLVVKTAESLGHKAVLVDTDEKSVEAAVNGALYELRIGTERAERYSLIETILNSASNGVFAVDASGRVTVFNPIAQAMLGAHDPGWRSKPVQRTLPLAALSSAIRAGRRVTDELVQLGDDIIAISVSPILTGGRPHGAVITIQGADKIQTLDFKIRKKRMDKGHVAKTVMDDIIGTGPAVTACKEMARRYANADATVLILGETGTGKEMFAQSIHNLSRRAQHPFVAVNCAALTPGLLESELFGYVKGAFTGARDEGKAGIFELAHTGSIFLDEIGELPLDVQSRLLRVIQEKQVTRIGGDSVIPVDVRILTATNRDLEREVEQGRFREDLFYRLSVLELRLPPLRGRPEDIPALVRHYVGRKCLEAGAETIRVPDDVMALIQRLPLRGNIRELINLLERALVIGNFASLPVDSLRHPGGARPPAARAAEGESPAAPQGRTLADIRKAAILSALEQCGNNKAAAARLLGISKATLWRRLKQLL